MDENLSSTSFVSSISTNSSLYQPKPPGGPKPVLQGFGRSSKTAGKVVRSPYLATSTPYSNKRRKIHSVSGRESLHSTSNGIVAPGHRNSNGVPLAWVTPHPSVPTFLRELMKTSGFSAVVSSPVHPKKRRTINCYSQPRGGSSRPNNPPTVSGQMDAIELRDEVVRIKKEMNGVMKERDLAKAQTVRLSKEIQKKDKQIEDLMNAGYLSTRDATRSLATSSNKKNASTQPSPGGGTSGNVLSLRKQVHSLEQALRVKEKEVTELKRGVSGTHLREMEVQIEVYCREIRRLNLLIWNQSHEEDGNVSVNKTPQSAREARIKLKALNQATIRMSSQLESLEEENRNLKKRNEMLLSGSAYDPSLMCSDAKEIGMRGSIADSYQDHNRAQMLAAIVKLELQCGELQSNLESSRESMDQARIQYERRIGELKGQLIESSNNLYCLENQLITLKDVEMKLKNVIQRLKNDRTHYRKSSEHTQSELQRVKELLEKEELGKEGLMKELQSLQEKHQNEMKAIEHSRKFGKKHHRIFASSKDEKEAAACTIQQNWRRRQAIMKQRKSQRETEDAMIDIQSTLSSHLARKKMLSSISHLHSPNPVIPNKKDMDVDDGGDSSAAESSEAIESIQSAMKGYLTRQMVLQDLRRFSMEVQSAIQ